MSSDQGHDEGSAAGLLEQLQRRLSDRGLMRAPLYRVVEVMRGPDGRLSRQGQIWHGDLGHARRFGRALAANSASHEVLVADARGSVIEQLATVGAERPPLGWDGWRDMALPPAPRAGRPNAALRRAPSVKPQPARAVPAMPPVLAEAVDLPLRAVEAIAPAAVPDAVPAAVPEAVPAAVPEAVIAAMPDAVPAAMPAAVSTAVPALAPAEPPRPTPAPLPPEALDESFATLLTDEISLTLP